MPRRRDLLQMTAALPAAFALSGAVPKLPNSIQDVKGAKLTREPFGDLRIYFDGPTDQLKSMNAGSLLLKAGMSPHPPHQHPEEEFMVVTEGTGEMTIEGKMTRVGPGSMLYVGGNKLHGVLNTGKTPLLFYFYKWQA